MKQIAEDLRQEEPAAMSEHLSRLQASWLLEGPGVCERNMVLLNGELSAAGWIDQKEKQTILLSAIRTSLAAGCRTAVTGDNGDSVLKLAEICLQHSIELTSKETLKEDVSLVLNCISRACAVAATRQKAEKALRDFGPFVLPAGYRGGFNSGQTLESITDASVRAKYADYLREQADLTQKYSNAAKLVESLETRSKSIRQLLAKCANTLGKEEFQRLVEQIKLKGGERAVFDGILPASS